MKLRTKIILLLFSVSLFSCEKALMHKEPKIDNKSVFEEYAKICIEKFGLQDVKNIDLKVITDSIRPLITWDLKQEDMFEAFGYMVNRMQEGHTGIQTIDRNFNKSFLWFVGYPPAVKYPIPDTYYYGSQANSNVQVIASEKSALTITYGYLPQDPEIGYIRIPTFNLEVPDNDLETMMKYLKDSKGIIIDVRDNVGGYIELATKLSSYFTNSEIMVGTQHIKNGPGKNDFAKSKIKLKPSGSSYTYTKPVCLLQNRITFSSGSLFCIMMSELSHVTTMGQIFGGGTGEIIDGFLSNGYHYTISTSNFVNNAGQPTDNGIEPDVKILIDPKDTDKDVVIEEAILFLK